MSISFPHPDMTTPCNHHDSTGRFNYFCHVKTLQDGVHGEYVKCTKCYKKWLPDEQTTQPPKWAYEAPRDNVAIDSTKSIKSIWGCEDPKRKDEMEFRSDIIDEIEKIVQTIQGKEYDWKGWRHHISDLRTKYL